MTRRRVGGLVSTLAAIASCASCATSPEHDVLRALQPSTSASPQVETDAAIAQRVEADMVARGRGKASAAAFVRTDLATYIAKNEEEASAFGARPTSDGLLIVKVYGSFRPIVSAPPGTPDRTVTTLIALYDLGTSRVIKFTSGNLSAPDVTDTAATPADGTIIVDLRSFGTPTQLTP